jgi:hypothetical protein
VETLEAFSAEAVVVTDGLREELQRAEPVLAEAQVKLGFHLAKADVHFERLCNRVQNETERAQAVIIKPTRRIGSAAAGIREVLKLFTQTDSDAASTLKR